MSRYEASYKELLNYSVVGAVTGFLYFGAIIFATEILNLEYRIAVSVSYVIAVSFHFIANREFTFAAYDGVVRKQLIRYLIVLLLNYLITIGVVTYLVDILFCSHYLAAIIAIGTTVAVGYIASKFWVFSEKED